MNEHQKMDAFELKHECKQTNKNGTVRLHFRWSSFLGAKVSFQKSGAKKLMEVEKFSENGGRKF